MQPVCVSPEAALELLSRLGEVLQKACTLIVHIVKDVDSAHQEHAGRLLKNWVSGLAHGISQISMAPSLQELG